MKYLVMKPLFLLLLSLVPIFGQMTDSFAPPKANCCLAGTAQTLADQLQDWNQLGRYHADNQRLLALPAEPNRVVFMGDSITDGWKLTTYFPTRTSFVNRGISGQTTAQMLVRMFPDVINLKPAVMVVLAGTNDIARNNGPQTFQQITDNFQAMTELAQAHGIRVILCSILPISDYTTRPQSLRRPPADILKLNAWLKDYAAKKNAIYVDYFAATVDERGFLKDGTSGDGLHPNAKGYEIMAPLVEAAIGQALLR
jgi:lysophospholipase L1-like esterase